MPLPKFPPETATKTFTVTNTKLMVATACLLAATGLAFMGAPGEDNENTISYFQCTDSDGGNKPFQKGILELVPEVGGATTTIEEQCLSNTLLEERVCNNTSPHGNDVVETSCSDQKAFCRDGACVPQLYSCSSPGTDQAVPKGNFTITNNSNNETATIVDSCLNSDTLLFGYCTNDETGFATSTITCGEWLQGSICLDNTCKQPFVSNFFSNDPEALKVMKGTAYNVDDPNWLLPNSQDINKNSYAYKILSAFRMLNYNTYFGLGWNSGFYNYEPHLKLLNKFQKENGFPVSSKLTKEVLQKVDERLAERELFYAERGKKFLLYDHMIALHPNDVSKDYAAMIYDFPLQILPPHLQINTLLERLNCVGQCLGKIVDANGNRLSGNNQKIDPNSEYYFYPYHFGPNEVKSKISSGPAVMDTALHEYGHYLDGFLYNNKADFPDYHLLGSINTIPFYEISYDIAGRDPKELRKNDCVKRLSDDPKDWISRYGFLGSGNCPNGTYEMYEDWAESFQIYVLSGKYFRAATLQSPLLAKKYDWLKNNIFNGVEYDTDLIQDTFQGCTDVPDWKDISNNPGHLSCNWDYVWDGELRTK